VATSSDLVAAELAPAPAPVPASLFVSTDPDELVTEIARKANALAAVIKKQKLDVSISGRRYVRVEGWTCLGTLCGVHPIVAWTKQLENGYEARAEARTLDGRLVGAAEAVCLRSERSWATRDDYALKSMAQTRAVSKALRGPLGFVMAMAGFEATPAEEVPAGGFAEAEVAPAKPARAPRSVAVPAEEPSPPAAEPDPAAASGAQLNNIYRLVNKIDQLELVPRAKMLEAIASEYALEQEPGSESLKGLSKRDASDLITRLMAKAGEGA